MKKSHPIRRFMLATAATVSGIVLLLALKPASDPAAASAQGEAAPQQTAAGQESPQGGSAQQSGTQTVTGDVVKTQYGPVQVRLTMSGGKITKADAVQAPAGGTSDQKTALAIPELNKATLTKQSADIDAVSGATYTSSGYKQSLQSALDKAKTAGGTSQSSGAAGASPSPKAPATQTRIITGKIAQTQYGPVQVRLTFAGTKVTKAEAVQAPSGGRSTEVSDNAVPKLNQEAVAAGGSADIDAVSGATYTSGGYKKSLQSALDKAGG
ncbi:FMN-binding protein [Streptomyces sp. NPDC005141]